MPDYHQSVEEAVTLLDGVFVFFVRVSIRAHPQGLHSGTGRFTIDVLIGFVFIRFVYILAFRPQNTSRDLHTQSHHCRQPALHVKAGGVNKQPALHVKAGSVNKQPALHTKASGVNKQPALHVKASGVNSQHCM